MRLSKNEYIYFSIAVLIICIFSLLLYFDFTSRSAIGQERIVGSIAFKKRVAQRKYSDQVVWDDIEQTSPVYNNDSIRTAEMSEAVIRLADGTEITVNENSMIQLSFSTDEIDIQFKGGSISTRRSDLLDKTISKLNIKTDDTTVNVAKSDVQLSGAKDKGVSLVVTRGNATVTTGGRERSVKRNQKIEVLKGSKDIRIYALLLHPLKPLPDIVAVTPEMTCPIAFSWENLKPEQDGIMEISDSVSFARILAARKITGNSASVTLPPGSYFWRLRAKNRKIGDVTTSDGRRFSIVRVEPAYLIYPDHGSVIQYGKSRPVINFKWNGSDMVQEYNLEIAFDQAMNRKIASYGTFGNAMVVDNLDHGTYFWRIISVIKISGNTSRVPSAVRMIKITKKKTIDPPYPQFPPDGETVSGTLIKEKGLNFSWQNDQDIQSAWLNISTTSDFSNVIFRGNSRSNFIKVRRKLEPGTYYWRIHGILAHNRLTEPSAIMKFSVVAGKNIALKYPADSSEIASGGNLKDVKLSWEKTDVYGEYLVQVSNDKAFSRIEREVNSTDNHTVISGINPGKHYWRVMLKNNDGGIVMKSSSNSFVVLDTLPEPTILSPENRETIDMGKLNEIGLRWKRLDEANAYRFRLYRIDNKKISMVTDRMIRGTNYDLADINFPGEGEYRWSVQAFEMNPDGSKIIRKSRVYQSSFNIQAAAAPKKIKIITPKVIYIE